MSDTGKWVRGNEHWFVVQKSDGSVVCNSDDGSFTAASKGTWEIWKRDHGWRREDAKPLSPTITEG